MRRQRLLLVFAASLLGGAIATFTGDGMAQDATPLASPAASVPTTAIIVSATNDPLRVTGSDGVDHLEYDLLVTNGFAAPVTLTSIVVAAPDGEPLLRLEGDDLVTATQPLLGRAPTAEIPASGAVAVVVDVTVPADQAVESVTHHITYEVAPDAPVRSLIGNFAIDGPELSVDPRPATVIAPPLRGDGWMANNGCCAAESIHRAVRVPIGGTHIGKQEIFAIDFAKLRDGQAFTGDGARPEDWYGFGAEVLAVADGAVVALEEGHPEENPLQPVTNVSRPADYGGNAITLEIAPGVYAYYAHLEPGSVTVAVGDRVTSGQVLGLLGNTGNSSGPHLHFGLIDDPDPLVGLSLPMVFDQWTLQGTFDMAAFEAAGGEDASSALILLTAPEPQTGTLQLYLDVADFGNATPVGASSSAAEGDFAGLVDIGGRSLYLECHGEGSPTVVLVAGYRASGRFWTDDLLQPDTPREMVMSGVAEFSRVCTYDRPGAMASIGEEILPSRSDPIVQPRTAPEVVAELHALLVAAEIPGPYVLAAHSMGGLFSRLYAATYPDEVVGLVLVDAVSEQSETLMTPERWEAMGELSRELGIDTVVPIPGYGDLETLPWGGDNAVVREAVAASPLPPMPLAVLAHGKPMVLPDETRGFTSAEWEAVQQASYQGLATLVPRARFSVASESGHDIHQDQPGVVIEAIRQVVTGVRNPETWYTLTTCCAP